MNWISDLFYSGWSIGSALWLVQNSEDAKQLRRVQELQGSECVSLKDKIIKFSRYISNIAWWWHHVKAEYTPISYSVSNVTLASGWPQTGGKSEGTNICKLNFGFSGRLSGRSEAIWGECCRKIFFATLPHMASERPESLPEKPKLSLHILVSSKFPPVWSHSDASVTFYTE